MAGGGRLQTGDRRIRVAEKSRLCEFTSQQIAEETYTSKSALVRFAKALGFAGWKDFAKAFASEQHYQEPHYSDVDPNIPFRAGSSTKDIINLMCSLQMESLMDTAGLTAPHTVDRVIDLLIRSERIALFGMSPNSLTATTLPSEMVSVIEDVGFLESIPLWAIALLGSLFIWVLSLVMILTVYSRFFKLYMATAIAPIPMSSFAGQPSSSIGIAFLKSYAAICLEGCVIVWIYVIFSAFASAPPAIEDDTLAAATIVWNYVGEVIFNMLVLVGCIKMSDRLIRELMGLG